MRGKAERNGRVKGVEGQCGKYKLGKVWAGWEVQWKPNPLIRGFHSYYSYYGHRYFDNET